MNNSTELEIRGDNDTGGTFRMLTNEGELSDVVEQLKGQGAKNLTLWNNNKECDL